MNYLNFDKSELINLEYSLKRETLRSNRAGSYACSTIVACNTRKYHGLLVTPMEHLDGDKHVLLSSVDCSIVHNGRELNLGIHKYAGEVFNPTGHQYIQDFSAEIIPVIYYRVGGVRISRELMLVEKEQQVLIRYTILECDEAITLKLHPFLAFRNMHQLSKANLHAQTKVKFIDNGIKCRLYDGYPYLHMQLSKNNEFVQFPNWYYNIEYTEEKNRGYEHHEDLFVPGFFEIGAKKGDVVVFSGSVIEASPAGLKRKFTAEVNKRIPRDSFKNCLKNSAEQFIFHKEKKTEVLDGFPWFGTSSRNTFISLPGLTLLNDDSKTFFAVIDSMVQKLHDGLFPSVISPDNPQYNSIDAPMWFIWSLQQYCYHTGSFEPVWKKYKKYIVQILQHFKKGTHFNIQMAKNGLIYGGEHGYALTWMDAVVHGKPVTPRIGFNVEVNALWYNNICFALELAEKTSDKTFVKQWKGLPVLIEQNFTAIFWDNQHRFLADTVNGEWKDWSVRPNQVIAAALEYSPLTSDIKKAVLQTVKNDLLTSRGLRTLAPRNPKYIGSYTGSPEQRDSAYHQGTVWPWLLEHFVEGWIKIYRKDALQLIKRILSDFEGTVSEHGIGSISEIYDGNPPHIARGAISQGSSVAALLSIIDKKDKLEQN